MCGGVVYKYWQSKWGTLLGVVGVNDIQAGGNDGEQLFMYMLLRVRNGEQ